MKLFDLLAYQLHNGFIVCTGGNDYIQFELTEKGKEHWERDLVFQWITYFKI